MRHSIWVSESEPLVFLEARTGRVMPLPPALPDPHFREDAPLATITVYFDNPGEEIEISISDEMLMKLFTDTAETKSSLSLLWRVVLLGMGSTATLSLSGLVAQLV